MPYFLLASPVLNSEDNTWKEIQSKGGLGSSGSNGIGKRLELSKQGFNLGNLDYLWFMMNHFNRLEAQIESNLKKVERQVQELDPKHKEFLIDSKESGRQTVENFIFSFMWDDSKYPKSSLTEINKHIANKVSIIEGELRTLTQAYQDKKSALNTLSKKEGGNYTTRDLNDVLKENVVKPDDFVNSEYLITAIAVVPKKYEKEWEEFYVIWNDYVVPESTKKFNVDENDGYTLWRVILLKNQLEDFTNECKTKKIVIRTFDYDPNQLTEKEEMKKKLANDINDAGRDLIEVCTTYFSDLYSAFIHLKVLKLMMDSVLRFGINEKLFFCAVKPGDAKEKKIHQGLTKLFSGPETTGMYGAKEEIDDTEDFYPYATVQITIP